MGMTTEEIYELGLVRCLGFAPGMSTSTAIGTLREAVWTAAEWRGWRIGVIGADVWHCFEAMRHEDIAWALEQIRTPQWLVHAILREYTRLEAKARVLGDPYGELFAVQRSGRTGGVETPGLLNILLQVCLRPVVLAWEREGLGFRAPLGERWGSTESVEAPALTNVVWADNVWLVPTSAEMGQRMLNDTTAAIEALGMTWKKKSLEVICGANVLIPHRKVLPAHEGGGRGVRGAREGTTPAAGGRAGATRYQ